MPLIEPERQARDPMLPVALGACCVVAAYWVFKSPVATAALWDLLTNVFELCFWILIFVAAALTYYVLRSFASVAMDKTNKRASSLRNVLAAAKQLSLGVPWAQAILVLGFTDTMLPFLPTNNLVKRLGQMFEFPDTTNSRLLLWGITSASAQCLQMAAASCLLTANEPNPITWRQWLRSIATKVLATTTAYLSCQPKPQRRKSNQPSTDSNRSKPRTPTAGGKAAGKAAKSVPSSNPGRASTPSASTSAPPHPAAAPGPSPHAPSRKSSKKSSRAATRTNAPTTPPAPDSPGASASTSPPPHTPGPEPAALDMHTPTSPAPGDPTAACSDPPSPTAPCRNPEPTLSSGPQPPERSGWLTRVCSRLWNRHPAPSPPTATAANPGTDAPAPSTDAHASSTTTDAGVARGRPPAEPQATGTGAGPEPDSGGCVVCLEGPADAGFLHGASLHQCVCRSCAAAFKIGQECPLCRVAIERIVEVFACTG